MHIHLTHGFLGRPFIVTMPDLVASYRQIHCCLNGKWLQNIRRFFRTKARAFALVCKIKGFAALHQGCVSRVLCSLPASAEHLWPQCSNLISSAPHPACRLAMLLRAGSCIINAPDVWMGFLSSIFS